MTIDDSRFNLNFGALSPYTIGFSAQSSQTEENTPPLFDTGQLNDFGFDGTLSGNTVPDYGSMPLFPSMGGLSALDMSSLALVNNLMNIKLPNFENLLSNLTLNLPSLDLSESLSLTPGGTADSGRLSTDTRDYSSKVPDNLNTRNINGVLAVALKDLDLKGSVGPRNSVPYIAKSNSGRLKTLDNFLSSKGYKFRYTSAMGGKHAKGANSHGAGQKVDLVLNNGQQLKSEDVAWLRQHGYIGNGAIGWHNAGSGYHYDLYIGNKVSLTA